MQDTWSKKFPDGRVVTYTREGEAGTGFVYVARLEQSNVNETSASQRELSREEVEKLFGNFAPKS